MSEPGSLLRSLSGKPAARNFHTFVINEIGAGIVSGRFGVGTILPSDAEMMTSYGVSRTVLREALRTLEAKGMVEARPKVGTRVSQKSRWNLFDQQVLAWHFEAELDPDFITGLFDIRSALEARAADLAARRRTAEQIRLLKYWIHQMELAEGDAETHALAELEVHRIIAEASGNPLLRSSVGLVELTLALVAVAGRDEGQAPRDPREPDGRTARPSSPRSRRAMPPLQRPSWERSSHSASTASSSSPAGRPARLNPVRS